MSIKNPSQDMAGIVRTKICDAIKRLWRDARADMGRYVNRKGCLPGNGFFIDRLQNGHTGRHSHIRGFVRPHDILMAAAVSASPTARHAGVLL